MREQFAKWLSGSEHVRSAAEVLSGLEQEQLQAAAALSDTAGLGYDIDVPAREDRTDAIAAVIEGMLGGDFEEWWRQNVATEQLDKAPPKKYVGAGKDSTEWEAQVEDWAEKVRAAGGSGSTRHLASVACQDVYGVPLGEFEQEVLDWDRSREAKMLIAGNFRAVRDIMQDATEALQAEESLRED